MSPHGPGVLPSGLHVAGDFLLSGPIRFTFGGPIHNLWPLLMLPALAAWAADRSAARLPRTPAASLPALVLAAAPGLLTLLLMANIALSLQGFVTWRGWILYRLTPAVAVALAAYAAVGLVRRQLALRRVFRIARPPSERLSRHALALGLRARELPTPDLECFVAGALRPTVFVSAGALARLDDEELRAALSHERAHAAARDPLILLALGVLRDLAPLGRGRGVDAFLMAREARADRAAAEAAGPLTLASALLALARPSPRTALVLPMAAAETLGWRMEALLGDPPAAGSPKRVTVRSWAPCAFLAWPLAQHVLLVMFCG